MASISQVWKLVRSAGKKQGQLNYGKPFAFVSTPFQTEALGFSVRFVVRSNITQFITQLLVTFMQIATSLFLGLFCFTAVLKYLTDSTQRFYWGIFLAGLTSVTFVQVVFWNLSVSYFSQIVRVTVLSFIRGILVRAVISSSKQSSDIGKITSLILQDAPAAAGFFMQICAVIVNPLAFAGCVGLVALYLQLSVLPVLGFWALLLLIQMRFLGPLAHVWESKHMEFVDQRLSEIMHAVESMMTLKLENMQDLFLRKIRKIRNLEVRTLYIQEIVELCLNLVIPLLFAKLPAGIVFLTYVALGKDLSVEAFAAIYVFGLMGSYHRGFSNAIQVLFQSKANIHRLQTFGDQISPDPMTQDVPNNSDDAVVFRDASFAAGNFRLDVGSMNFAFGECVNVFGPPGSGKSLLLNGLLGEVSCQTGSVSVIRPIGFCPQQLWALNDSIRNNIVFVEVFDQKRYDETIRAVCLNEDFSKFSEGDHAQIGGNAECISGGQKQRINFARALYSGSPLLLLDDPLSAVDNTVSARILRRVKKLIANRCVLVCSSTKKYLGICTSIIELSEDKVSERKLTSAEIDCAKMKADEGNYVQDKSDEDEPKDDEGDETKAGEQTEGGHLPFKSNVNDSIRAHAIVSSLFSKHNITSLWVPLLLPWICMGCGIGVDMYAAVWLSRITGGELPNNIVNVTIFLCFVLAGILLLSIGFYWGVVVILRFMEELHGLCLRSVFYAVFPYFTSTTPGEILGNFSNGVDIGDRVFSFLVVTPAIPVLGFIGTSILLAFIYPFSLLVIPPLLLVFVVLAVQFRTRLHTTGSNFVNIIMCTAGIMRSIVAGLPVIRAKDTTGRMAKYAFQLFTNCHHRMLLNEMMVMLAFLVMGILQILFVSCVSFVAVTLISGSTSVLFFFYGLSFVQDVPVLLGIVLRSQGAIITVKKYQQLLTLPQENDAADLSSVPRSWPTKGLLMLSQVAVRYLGRLLVSGASLTVRPSWRVGIVGRTGSGKSTLMNALPRLWDYEGNILLDNVDIKQVPLTTLRDVLGFVCQKSSVLRSTFEDNINPFRKSTDTEIQSLLNLLNVESGVLSEVLVPEKLSASLAQTISFLRAFAKKASIYVIDEGSSSLDENLTDVCQKYLRDQGKTLFWVSHQLRTTMFCDKIGVIDNGRIVAFCSPKDLEAGKSEIFSRLLQHETAQVDFKEHGKRGLHCSVCQIRFGKVQKMHLCDACGNFACSFCTSSGECYNCIYNNFLNQQTGGGARLRLALSFQCSAPSLSGCCVCNYEVWGWDCGNCNRHVCSICSVFVRSCVVKISRLSGPFCCKICAPVLLKRLQSFQREKEAIVEANMLTSQLHESCVFPEIRKEVCSSCGVVASTSACCCCAQMFCFNECGLFLHIPEKNNSAFSRVCRGCAQNASFSLFVCGISPPPFQLSSRQQLHLQNACSVCSSKFSLVFLPEECSTCGKWCCLQCMKAHSGELACHSCYFGVTNIDSSLESCDFCGSALENDLVVLNEKKLHPHCLEPFRLSHLNDNTCTFCGLLVFAKDRIILNGEALHAECIMGWRRAKQGEPEKQDV